MELGHTERANASISCNFVCCFRCCTYLIPLDCPRTAACRNRVSSLSGGSHGKDHVTHRKAVCSQAWCDKLGILILRERAVAEAAQSALFEMRELEPRV